MNLKQQLIQILVSFIDENFYKKKIQKEIYHMLTTNNNQTFFLKYISKDKEYLKIIKNEEFATDFKNNLIKRIEKSPYLSGVKKSKLSFEEELKYFLEEPNFEFFLKHEFDIFNTIDFLKKTLKDEEYLKKCQENIPNFLQKFNQFVLTLGIKKEKPFSGFSYRFIIFATNLFDKINKTNLYKEVNLEFLKEEGKFYANEGTSIDEVVFKKEHLKEILEILYKIYPHKQNYQNFKFKSYVSSVISNIPFEKLEKYNKFFFLLREFENTEGLFDERFVKIFLEYIEEIKDIKETTNKEISILVSSTLKKRILSHIEKNIKTMTKFETKSYIFSSLSNSYNYLVNSIKHNHSLEFIKELGEKVPELKKFIQFNDRLNEMQLKNNEKEEVMDNILIIRRKPSLMKVGF